MRGATDGAGHAQHDRTAWSQQVLVLRDLGFSPSVQRPASDSLECLRNGPPEGRSSGGATYARSTTKHLFLRRTPRAFQVAAAYADSRMPLDAIIERMFEDGVDFEEEPVWCARERTVKTASKLKKFVTSVGSRVGDVFRGAVSPKASSSRASAYRSGPAETPTSDVDDLGLHNVASSSDDDAWTPMLCPDTHNTYWTNPLLELSAWSDPRQDPSATLYDARPM